MSGASPTVHSSTHMPATPQDPYRPGVGTAISLLYWSWFFLLGVALGLVGGALIVGFFLPGNTCGPLEAACWQRFATRLDLPLANLTPAGQAVMLVLVVVLYVAAGWAATVRARASSAYRKAMHTSNRAWRTTGAERLRLADAAAAAYRVAAARAWAAPRGYWARERAQLAIVLAARVELTPAAERARWLGEPNETLLAAAASLAAFDRRAHLGRLDLYAWSAAHVARSSILALRAQPLATDERLALLDQAIAGLRAAHDALPGRARRAIPAPRVILDNALCARLRERAKLLPAAVRMELLTEAAHLYQASAGALAHRPWLRAGNLKLWTDTLTALAATQTARAQLAPRDEKLPVVFETVTVLRAALALLARPGVRLRLRLRRAWHRATTSRAAIANQLALALRQQASLATGAARRALEHEALAFNHAALGGNLRRLDPLTWATSQQTYGSALLVAALEREGTAEAVADLDGAAVALRAALEVPVWSRDPSHLAATQRLLAMSALWQSEMAHGDARARLLESASGQLAQALAARTREQDEDQWASTQFYVAVCREHQGEQAEGAERQRLLREAEMTGAEVVRMRESGPSRQQWAPARHNLSTIQIERARLATDLEWERLLDDAAAGLRAVLAAPSTNRQLPAISRTALGLALVARAERAPGGARASLLEQAVAACRAALDSAPDDLAPRHSCEARTTLAAALLAQSERAGAEPAQPTGAPAGAEGDTVERRPAIALIEEAVALSRAACATCAREYAPRAWAGAHLRLAEALTALAGATGAADNEAARKQTLDEAISLARAALTVHTRDTYPVVWAGTLASLGEALAARAAISPRSERAALAREAAQAWRSAREVLTAQDAPYYHDRILAALSQLAV